MSESTISLMSEQEIVKYIYAETIRKYYMEIVENLHSNFLNQHNDSVLEKIANLFSEKSEKRRAIEKLIAYLDKGYFISFSNMKSGAAEMPSAANFHHDTPYGISFYPLKKQIISYLMNSATDAYGTERKYIFLAKPKNTSNIISLAKTQGMPNSHLKYYLKKIFETSLSEKLGIESVEKLIVNITKDIVNKKGLESLDIFEK